MAARSVAMLAHPDQWARCGHDGTALLPAGGVTLDWVGDDLDPCDVDPAEASPGGLAFDRWCTAYRSWPGAGAVQALPVGGAAPAPVAGPLDEPRGLAVDDRQRLYVVESGSHSVLVHDLWERRLLARVPLAPGHPVDVAADGRGALVLLADGALVRLDGRRPPGRPRRAAAPRCPQGLRPVRLVAGPLLLWTGGGHGVVAGVDGTVQLEVPGASGLARLPGDLLVVARGPGRPFRRFAAVPGGGWRELEPVGAPDHDGAALAVDPAGRLAYTTPTGLGRTTGPVAAHRTSGSVLTYRLDSGAYRTRWGRLFLDACIPPETDVRVRFLTSDLDEVPDPVDGAPAARSTGRPPHPEATPPLPSRSLLAASTEDWPVVRRPTGRETPWVQIAADDPTETYETPVHAAPGRYLWLQLLLTGTAAASPVVTALRVERPGHRLLDSLPRAWSRDDGDADFLARWLAPPEGTLHDLDLRAAERAVLLDPAATPQEALPWLASLAGLVLDRRWPDRARRQLVAEAYPLYARRGTKAALLRLLEIYLGRPAALVEAWQLRGLGGGVLGGAPVGGPAPGIGSSARATGMLGRFSLGDVGPDGQDLAATAHRFTVLVAGPLTGEQREIVADLLRTHRPAHTVGELCEVGDGMRVGDRLRVALTSYVGPCHGCAPALTGATRLGTDGVVGVAVDGDRVGDARVGAVSVG